MILIVRHYKFREESTTFGELNVDSLYITQKQLNRMGNSAAINIKISADDSEEFNSICLSTGHRFNLESSTIVYKAIR